MILESERFFLCLNKFNFAKSATEALYAMHLRGINLDLKLYSQAVKLLKDDFEDVRMEAVKLIWYFWVTEKFLRNF
jgi:glycyl-tRNA synthetase alpha subunit